MLCRWCVMCNCTLRQCIPDACQVILGEYGTKLARCTTGTT